MSEEIPKITPKSEYIEGTADLLKKAEDKKEPYLTEIEGQKFIIYPNVFNPEIFFSSKWFAKNISDMIKNDTDFLEVGCGTGIVSIKVAEANPNLTVVSTDINPFATKNTIENVKLHNLDQRISAYQGDVFDGVKQLERKYDSIFWAMPFGYLPPETAISIYESQVHDPGYRAIEKFFAEANDLLKDNGRLLIGFSSDIGHPELLKEIAQKYNFSLELKNSEKGTEKDEVSMEIWEARLKQ